MGRQFAFTTALAIVLATVELPRVTTDTLLGAVFDFAIRGGAVIDGTEVLDIYLSQKMALIFGTAAHLLSVEIDLCLIIIYLSASRNLDFLIQDIEEFIGVTIISLDYQQIREMITTRLGRGLTVYNSRSGFDRSDEKKHQNIIYVFSSPDWN